MKVKETFVNGKGSNLSGEVGHSVYGTSLFPAGRVGREAMTLAAL